MKVLFIITGLSTGGAEMMLLKLLERIDRRRYEPFIISLSTKGVIGSRIESLGISTEALEMRPGLPNPVLFYRLVKRIGAIQPDVVHTWMYHADLLGGLAARFAGIRAIGWAIRHSNLDRDKTKLVTRLVVYTCALVSGWVPRRIVSCSEVARQIHVAVGYAAPKMLVIPNGFDLALFQPDAPARSSVRAELGVGQDVPLVGLVGRFDPQKNHAGFFEAAGLLHRYFPEIHFVLAGKDIHQNNNILMQAVRNAGVEGVTHLLSIRTDIPRLMAALDVLVSSSYGEAFPNVLGEAMACGVPCAVTDVGDSAYIVGDTGEVVASGDMVRLAEAIKCLLALPTEERHALGVQARARIADNFEIGKVVRQYESFYEELAGLSQKRK